MPKAKVQKPEVTAGGKDALMSIVECKDLRGNGHVVINGRPCKIVDMARCHSGFGIKVFIQGIDVFTGRKLSTASRGTDEMQVPTIISKQYELVTVGQDDLLELVADDGSVKHGMTVPEGDYGKQIWDGLQADEKVLVTILSAMGEDAVISVRQGDQVSE
ncbi:eukaryotic translation initiation factor 5A-2 [Mycena galericulata]|nr:eukaryotic translation initiation factor 5A-2 [Mycena galericulata]